VTITYTTPVPPAITSGASTTFSVGSAETFEVTATGVPAPVVTSFGQLPFGVSFRTGPAGTATISGTPAFGTAGAYPVTISASNVLGAATQSFVLNVSGPTVFTTVPFAVMSAAGPGTFVVEANGSPAPTITEVGKLPAGVSFTRPGSPGFGQFVVGRGGAPPGTYTVKLVASNGAGPAVSESFTLKLVQGGPGGRLVAPCSNGVGNVRDLRMDIGVLDADGGGTVVLSRGCTYTMSAPAYPDTSGETGLPPVTAPLTVEGNGAELVVGPSDPYMRFFETLMIATLTIDDTSLVGGDMPDPAGGGAVFALGGRLVLQGVTMAHDTASAPSTDFPGGAVVADSGLEATGSTFVDDTAASGGAVFVAGGTSLLDDTFASDHATGDGGAAFFVPGTLQAYDRILHSTFVGDTAEGGGAYWAPAPAQNIVEVQATIVAGGGPSECEPYYHSDYNASDEGCFKSVGDIVDPGLAATVGPLAPHGGPVETIALLRGSPAIGPIPAGYAWPAGFPPLCSGTDARGVARPAGDCDIGAYQTTQPTSQLSGVSCVASSDCVAIGSYVAPNGRPKELGEAWNGKVWQIRPMSAPATGTLSGVSCVDASECTAVGSYLAGTREVPLVETWDGAEWTAAAAPSPAGATGSWLSAVSCTRPWACTAVGYDTTTSGTHPLVERWNGLWWSLQSSASPSGLTDPVLTGVACSALTCVAVGEGTAGGAPTAWAESSTGLSWRAEAVPVAAGTSRPELLGVACSSAASCTAVGQSSLGALAERWDGSAWADVTTPISNVGKDSSLDAVSCTASTACVATGTTRPGSNFVPLVEEWDGARWSDAYVPPPSGAHLATLAAVSCTGPEVCSAVGYRTFGSNPVPTGLAEASDPSGWYLLYSPNPLGS
jgi:hypothetical protein